MKIQIRRGISDRSKCIFSVTFIADEMKAKERTQIAKTVGSFHASSRSFGARAFACRLQVLVFGRKQLKPAPESRAIIPPFPAILIVGCLLALFMLIGCSSPLQTSTQPFAALTLPPNPTVILPLATPTTWMPTAPPTSSLTPTVTPTATITPYPTRTSMPPQGVPLGVTMTPNWGQSLVLLSVQMERYWQPATIGVRYFFGI